MSQFDIKIGEETKSQQQKDTFSENLNIQQEIQYLHSIIRDIEYKRREQHRTTNNFLMWILICMLIYIIPDIIIKIFKFVTLTNILQEIHTLIR